MSELLSCPFCGGEAETWDGAGPWHVVCTKCGTIGSPCLSEAEAIAAWNSRATLGSGTCEPNWVLQGKTQTQEFWRCECGNCGYEFGVEDRSTFPFKMTIDEVDVPNFCPECGAKQKYPKRGKKIADALGWEGEPSELFEDEQVIATTLGRGTGEWVLEHSGTLYDKWRCSKCGYLFVEPRCDQGYSDLEPNFCPKCGVDFREEGDLIG